jgi:hypothetical protein
MKKNWLKTRKIEFQSNKNYAHPVVIYPWNTRNTAGTGYGIATGQNFEHRTRTRTTRGPNTAGIPILVPNPTNRVISPQAIFNRVY